MNLLLAVRLARRELRGGLKHFGVFLACLALGTTVIAAVGSLAAAVEKGLAEDARSLLGGDIQASLAYQPLPQAQRDFLTARGRVSAIVSMRAMAGPEAAPGGQPADSTLVELKAVDSSYPLYGAVELAPAMPLGLALAEQGGLPGAAADRELLARLGLHVGDRLRVGDAAFRVAAVIVREPDRGFQAFTLGPRLLVSDAGLAATGLLRPGSLVTRAYRVRLDAGRSMEEVEAGLKAFPDLGLRVTRFSQAAPNLTSLLERMELYLTLVGLTSLLVGGLGVAGAVDAYLAGKLRSIAIFKSLGASGRMVLAIYLLQVLMLASGGVAVGLAVGALLPLGLTGLLADILPVGVRAALFPAALAKAAGFGLATALAFALPPLLRSLAVSPAGLFRSYLHPGGLTLSARARLTAALAALGLAAYSLWASPDRRIAFYFAVGAAGAYLLLSLAAMGLVRLARHAAGTGGGGLRLSLALRFLGRSPAAAARIMLSLGLGLTVLLVIALLQGNLRRQVSAEMPRDAPSYFFIDIQPDQAAAFDRLVAQTPGVLRAERQPMLRARITAIKGVPADEAAINPDVSWAVRSERGLSAMALPPANGRVVAGEWWPPEASGRPLLSLTRDIAEGFGMTIGDELTISLLGRPLTLTVANLREVDWATLGMNFSLIVPPGVVDDAPQTHIATVYASGPAEEAVFRAVTRNLPGVSAVRIREALDSVGRLIGGISGAVSAVAGVTLAAGLLVLGETLGATLRRRRYEAVVLKTLGAGRGRILGALLLENLLLGLAAGAVAAGLGTLAAWLAVTRLMRLVRWHPLPEAILGVVALGLAATLLMSLAGLRRALGHKPASMLRNE